MKIYRVTSTDKDCSFWYDENGQPSEVFKEYGWLTASKLPMPFDQNMVGWLSGTFTMEQLYGWFSKEELIELCKDGKYCLHEYETNEWRDDGLHASFRVDSYTSKRKITIEYEII